MNSKNQIKNKEMKKLLLVSSLSLFLFSACNKCAACHYDFNGDEVEIGEYCGDDLEMIENSGFQEGDSTYTVHCHDH